MSTSPIDHVWKARALQQDLRVFAYPTAQAQLLVHRRGGTPTVFLCGPSTSGGSIAVQQGTEVEGVELWPWALQALTGIPASELVDKVVQWTDLGLCASAPMARIGVDLGRGAALDARALEEMLGATEFSRKSQVVGRAAALLEGEHERQSISALATDAGYSVRQLERFFYEQVGLPPGRFRSLRRLARAAGRLESGHRAVDAAHAAGYADQAHMCRVFQSVLGMTPTAVQNRLCDVGNVQDLESRAF